MADTRWIGNAAAVADVYTVQITAYHASTTYKVTINGKTVSVIGAGTVNDTATALQVALAASTIPEFQEVTWTVSTDTVTGTGATAGLPVTVTATVSGGTGTLSLSHVTTATGPNFADNAANWSGGSVPADSDVVYVDDSEVPILYGLDLSSIQPAAVHIRKTFTASEGIGLPKVNPNGYQEYRETYWKIGPTTLIIDAEEAGTIRINTGTDQTAIEIRSGTVEWIGTHASNTAETQAGDFSAAKYGGEAATLATYRHVGGTAVLSTGVSLTTMVVGEGTLEFASAVTTYTQYGAATVTFRGSAAMGTGTQYAGILYFNSSGGVGTSFTAAGGRLDCSQDLSPKTFAALALNGGDWYDPLHVVTVTALTRGASVDGLGPFTSA